ncbi:MAG: MipA/OmpV family protein [Pseudomonadota bacterium]
MTIRHVLTLAAASTLFVSLPDAQAQQQVPNEGWQVSVGAAAAYSPVYRGDDENQLVPLPFIHATYGDRLTLSVPQGIQYAVVKTPNLEVGPVLGLDFGREEDGEGPFGGDGTDDLIGLGDIDPTVELGGYINYRVGPVLAEVQARQGLGGHDGFIADFSLNAMVPAKMGDKRGRFLFGPRLRYADETYLNSFYGITAAQSIGSGLSVYEADAGIESYGLGASLMLPLNQRWALSVTGDVSEIAGDAADSPLIVKRGDTTQTSLIAALTYRFGG